MANAILKTDFKNGDKLYDHELNNNFRAIEAALGAMNKIVWQDSSTGTAVLLFKGNAQAIEGRELADGQLLYNINTGETYIDTYVDGVLKRINTGSGNVVAIQAEEPTNEATTLWIEDETIDTLASELTGNHTNSDVLGYKASFLNDKLVHVGTSVDGDYRVNVLKSNNIFGNYAIVNGWISSTTMRINSNQGNRLAFIPCKPNTTYTITRSVTTSTFRVSDYTTIPAMTNSNVDYTVPTVVENNSGTSITYTTSANAKYLIVHYGLIEDTNLAQSLASIKVAEGTTGTTDEYMTPSIYVGSEKICQKNIVGEGNITYANVGGNLYYHKIGNVVILNIQDLTSANTINGASLNNIVIAKGFPKNSGNEFGTIYNYNYGGTTYTSRLKVTSEGSLVLWYGNIKASEKYYGVMVYTTND